MICKKSLLKDELNQLKKERNNINKNPNQQIEPTTTSTLENIDKPVKLKNKQKSNNKKRKADAVKNHLMSEPPQQDSVPIIVD